MGGGMKNSGCVCAWMGVFLKILRWEGFMTFLSFWGVGGGEGFGIFSIFTTFLIIT